jgi:two-component system chemotaxis response regulator CheY
MTLAPLPDTLPRDLTVMVVDGDLHTRNLLRQLLFELGIRSLLTARSGTEALDQQASCSGPLDLVLCSMDLSDMDGFTLTDRMRADQPDLNFVLLAHDATGRLVQEARGRNLVAYLLKPVAPDQLREKVVGALLHDRGYKSRSWRRSAEGQAFLDDATPEMRALFDLWDKARGEHAMPPREFLSDRGLRIGGAVERRIFIVTVEPPKPRLRYGFVGEELLARLGLNVVGTCVDEQHFLYRRYAQPAYDRVLRHRIPHYRRVGAIELLMRIRYQRLLLPFGNDDDVKMILGCVQPR